jgi:hypothetical protein
VQVTLGLGSSPIAHGRVQSELSYLPKPAAASGFTYTLSTNYLERPIALGFELATDSNAANRQIGLQLQDPAGNFLAAVPVASVQTASLTWHYSFLASLSSASAVEATVVMSPLFNFVIPDDYSLVVTLTNHEVGDQISNILYYRDRFSTGPDGYPIGGYNLQDLAMREVVTLNQG